MLPLAKMVVSLKKDLFAGFVASNNDSQITLKA